MTKTEFSRLIQGARHLCDDLLTHHPIDERLLSAQAVLTEAGAFVQNYWPDIFSEKEVVVECADDRLRLIQGRLMNALAILNSFTTEMRRIHIESGK